MKNIGVKNLINLLKEPLLKNITDELFDDNSTYLEDIFKFIEDNSIVIDIIIKLLK